MGNQPHRVSRLFQLIKHLKTGPAKSIRNLSTHLDTSSRTVYRYLELLKELGFKIDKDLHGKIRIREEVSENLIGITQEEAKYLEQLIKTAADRSRFKECILVKLRQVIEGAAEVHPHSEYASNEIRNGLFLHPGRTA